MKTTKTKTTTVTVETGRSQRKRDRGKDVVTAEVRISRDTYALLRKMYPGFFSNRINDLSLTLLGNYLLNDAAQKDKAV